MRMSRDVIRLNPSLSRRALKQARVKDDTDYEQVLIDQCGAVGIPSPLRGKGATFARVVGLGFEGDLYWIEPRRVVAEINGQIWAKGGHTSGAGLTRDFFKQNIAQLVGVDFYFEFSPAMVESGLALLTLECAFGMREPFDVDWRALWQEAQIKRARHR